MDDSIAKIVAFRHGSAFYRQGIVTVKRVDDLTLQGKKEIVRSAKKIVPTITFDKKAQKEVAIFTSPYARAAQSATWIALVLQKNSVKSSITLTYDLRECENLSWDVLQLMIKGGEKEFDGSKIFIDPSESNPFNLGYPEYYTEDCLAQIPEKVLRTWPTELVSAVKKTENSFSCTKRMTFFLRRLRSNCMQSKEKNIILVTHDALLNKLAAIATGNQKKSIEPGHFITMEFFPKKIILRLEGFKAKAIGWNELPA